MKLGILASHPIQYQVPLFKALAKEMNVHVYFAHRATRKDQAKAGFGVEFDWDIDLLSGYPHTFLKNVSSRPGTDHFFGCDTPEITDHIQRERFSAFMVMGWHLKSYWQAVFACRKNKIPVLVRGDTQLSKNRNVLVRFIKKIFYPLMLRQFDAFLVVGTRMKEYLSCYGVPETRMFWSPHFVDNEWFASRARMTENERIAMRRSLGLDEHMPLLIFVGKLLPWKRPLDILYAIKILRDEGIPTQAVFIGAGPLHDEINQTITKLQVNAKILGFKNQTELPRYYAISDLLILPSETRETWGLVVNEAMACGKPAIVADTVGCAPDLIDEDETGATFVRGDIVGLADAIGRSLKNLLDKKDVELALQKKMQQYSVATVVESIKTAVNFAGLENYESCS